MARRAEHVFRALTLICMGAMALAAIIIAADPLRRFSELAQGTLVYYTVSLVGGLALLLLAFLALKFPPQFGKIVVGGLAAALILAINQVAGLRFSTILCFTPS